MEIKSHVTYYENGSFTESYGINNKLHNINDEPALILFYDKDHIEREEWYQNGKRHRIGDKPAEIEYYENGKFFSKKWYWNNKLHRIGEPAIIYLSPDGDVESEEWYYKGNSLNEDQIKYMKSFRLWLELGENQNFFQFLPHEMMTFGMNLLGFDKLEEEDDDGWGEGYFDFEDEED